MEVRVGSVIINVDSLKLNGTAVEMISYNAKMLDQLVNSGEWDEASDLFEAYMSILEHIKNQKGE